MLLRKGFSIQLSCEYWLITVVSIMLWLSLCSSFFSFAYYTGGGALNVPIFYFIWGFTYKESVIMSLSTLMGNYLAQVSTYVLTLLSTPLFLLHFYLWLYFSSHYYILENNLFYLFNFRDIYFLSFIWNLLIFVYHFLSFFLYFTF